MQKLHQPRAGVAVGKGREKESVGDERQGQAIEKTSSRGLLFDVPRATSKRRTHFIKVLCAGSWIGATWRSSSTFIASLLRMPRPPRKGQRRFDDPVDLGQLDFTLDIKATAMHRITLCTLSLFLLGLTAVSGCEPPITDAEGAPPTNSTSDTAQRRQGIVTTVTGKVRNFRYGDSAAAVSIGTQPGCAFQLDTHSGKERHRDLSGHLR